MATDRTVRITLELNSRFVRLLDARVRLGLLQRSQKEAQLDPSDIVTLLVWSEACGHHAEEQAALIPPECRDIAPTIINDERRVLQAEREGEEGR